MAIDVNDPNWKRYTKALHGIQSHIAFEIKTNVTYVGAEPKHLRTGIDSAHVSDRAFYDLLLAKGVFTESEYIEALAVAAERELQEREDEVRQRLGRDIKFA